MTDRPLRLAVVGGFSSGKSALINALLGRALAPMGDTPVTAVSHRFGWAAEPTATFVYQDGRQEERPLSALSMLSGDAAALARVREVRIGLPMSELQDLEIWDTPGFGSNMLSHELAARKALQDADVAVWVTPIDAALNRSERDKLEYLRATETPVLLVVNKADLAEDRTDRDEAIAAITQDAGTLASHVVWISATLALADPSSPAVSGMDGLLARLADLRLQQRARLRAAAATVIPARPMNANDVCCVKCQTIGSFDDRFCVCGHSLADQHRPCPRCAVDNTVTRPRCRGCNLVFESWTRGAAFAERAEEEIERCLLIDAEASLELAVEAVPENETWSARRDQVATARQRAADLVSAAGRCQEAHGAISEWTRAIDLAVGLGVAKAAAAREIGAGGLAWAASHADPEGAVAVLEWWLPQGVVDGALLRSRMSELDEVRASAARAKAVRTAQAEAKLQAAELAAREQAQLAQRARDAECDEARERCVLLAERYRAIVGELATINSQTSVAASGSPSSVSDPYSLLEDELRRLRRVGGSPQRLRVLEGELGRRIQRWSDIQRQGLDVLRRGSRAGCPVSLDDLLSDGGLSWYASVVACRERRVARPVKVLAVLLAAGGVAAGVAARWGGEVLVPLIPVTVFGFVWINAISPRPFRMLWDWIHPPIPRRGTPEQ